MNSNDPVVVLSAARTPLGGFQGVLTSLPAPRLGAVAITAATKRAGVAPTDVEEVLMGCVLPAGIGQAPARQAALLAGLPLEAHCTTVSKVCGSGMKALMIAHDSIVAGNADLVVAGGMESMTNAPYLVPKARGGLRLGHGALQDHMFFDGLEDHYGDDTRGRLMGTFAEDCARHFQFSREAQDAFATSSTLRALAAHEAGHFEREMVYLDVETRSGALRVDRDEQPPKSKISAIPTLKPAFASDGTVTAANSSSISDGAAALVLTRRSTADRRGLAPLARIVGHASHAQAPRWFTTAPAGAVRKLLERVGWRIRDVDLWEINEAFAVVTLAAMKELDLPPDRVNVHGGACALGHPIGATGARIVVTLIGALKSRGLKRGIATLCIGGGEATAIAIEMG
jgi:acetyl-CoA C-acetyltransferase